MFTIAWPSRGQGNIGALVTFWFTSFRSERPSSVLLEGETCDDLLLDRGCNSCFRRLDGDIVVVDDLRDCEDIPLDVEFGGDGCCSFSLVSGWQSLQ
jgi:hypothetical protein